MGLTGMGRRLSTFLDPSSSALRTELPSSLPAPKSRTSSVSSWRKFPACSGCAWKRWRLTSHHSLEATALAAGTIVVILACRLFSSRIPAPLCARTGHGRGMGIQVAGRDHWLAVQRNPKRHAALSPACVSNRSDSRTSRPSLTIAMLGAIESLMSAVVSDRMSGSSNIKDRHNPNVELVAQGIANVVSPMLADCPPPAPSPAPRPTSAREQKPRRGHDSRPHAARDSALRLEAGKFRPMAVLAGILIVVSYNMASGARSLRCSSSPRPTSACGWSHSP